MIRIERLNNKIILTKDKDDSWSDCSYNSLRERFSIKEDIESHQFKDGCHIGSELHLYLKENIIGLTLESAREKLENEDFRIVKINHRDMAVTDDFNSGRYNLEIENNIVVKCYGG